MNTQLILHVDDSWECRRLVRAVLTFHGYEVIEAVDGAQGVTLAKRHTPSLILMDVDMPEMNGIQATERIKRIGALRHIPVIALTATDKASDYEAMMDAGCCAYILKPFSPAQLSAEVKTRLPTLSAAV